MRTVPALTASHEADAAVSHEPDGIDVVLVGYQDQGNLGSDTGSKVSGRLTGPDWPLETGSDAAPPVGPGR